MALFDNIFLEIITLSLVISWVSFWGAVLKNKIDMKRYEMELRENSIIHEGSNINHGMASNHKKGIGVIRYSQPSNNWFKRLL